MVAAQATAVVTERGTALRKYVTGRSPRSRAADQQVPAGLDAVTMTTERLPVAGGR